MTNNSFIIIAMENKTIEFILSEDQSLSFDSKLNEVLDNVSPFKEMLEKSDYTEYSAVFDGNKDAIINFSDVFHLRVNVKGVGGFDFIFSQNGFEKDKIIEMIAALKEMPVENIEQAKEKVNALFDTVKEKNPLFMLYSPKGEFVIQAEDLSIDIFKFYIKKVEKPVKPAPEKKERKPKEPKQSKTSFSFSSLWSQICDFFSPIKDNIVHYAFIMVSVFLIGFSSSVGVYYCYAGNNVFYFLFVCSLVGAILNYFVYYDFFKKHKFLSNDFILTVIDVFLSIGIAIGGFYIFYVLQKELPESLSGPSSILLIMAGVVLGVNIIVSPIAFLFRKRKEK